MIFKFRIVSDEVDNFKREIEIDADDTFLSLRNAICDSVGYDKGQMSSFFICEDGWEKGKEITLEDMGADSSIDVYLMEESILSDFVEDEGQRLIFVFDYLTERCFFMELKKTEPGKSLLEPVCTLSMGAAPPQEIDINAFDAQIDAQAGAKGVVTASDLDEDFYGDSEYSPEEFDAEGFDEMNFDDPGL